MGTILTREVYPTVLSEVYRVLRPDGIIRVEELHHSVRIILLFLIVSINFISFFFSYQPAGTVMIESFIETRK
jgi:ubiquinone/menaquinone biosynthesis C-methylase UbiE